MSNVQKVKGIQFEPNRFGFICALSRRETESDLRFDDNYRIKGGVDNPYSKTVTNSFGYMGYFQFGRHALTDVGYMKNGKWTGLDGADSEWSFLNSREIQLKAVNRLIDNNCKYIRNNNLNEYIGKTINGIELTESGLVAACHLVGLGGLTSFLDVPTNLKYIKDRKGNVTNQKHKQVDGNNVHVSEYIKLFNHYDLESCCNRKIRVSIKNNNNPVEGLEVTIKSSYRGKLNKQSFTQKHTTDAEGRLPVIVRHPGAEVILVIKNKESEKIIQLKDSIQTKTINISGNVIASAPLAKPSQPESKPNEDKTPQQQREQSKPPSTDNAQNEIPKDVKFNIKIVEGDTGKAITNMKFLLTYKGNLKQHISDGQGVKHGIIAETGRDIEVSVAGEKANQVIGHFTTHAGLEGQTVSIKLPVHNFKLTIFQNDKPVPNAVFSLFYRGREIPKRTNARGEIQTKMLVGFVYGFGVKEKSLVKFRVMQSLMNRNINVNAKAVESSNIYEDLMNTVQKTIDAIGINTTQPNTKQKAEADQAADKAKAKSDPNSTEQKNTHTEKSGSPLTTVSNQPVASSDTTRYHIYANGKIKRENSAATGFAEFIYYEENGTKHNLGKSAFIKANTWAKKGVKGSGNTYLVHYEKHSKYKKGNLGYVWNIISQDKRFYLSGLGLSAVLGAMCKFGYMQYVGSGFSTKDGGPGVSVSHINGVNGDFRYIGKNNAHVSGAIHTTFENFDWDQNVKFVNLLHLFGYKKFLSSPVSIKNNALLPFSNAAKNHHHHIHLQGFSPNVEDI